MTFTVHPRYNTARDIKESQDSYCSNALAGRWDRLAGKSFPESLQWEALVDVIRGRVKASDHQKGRPDNSDTLLFYCRCTRTVMKPLI